MKSRNAGIPCTTKKKHGLIFVTLLCSEIYNYVNDFNSVDIYGNNLLNRSSAAHGTDVVYLLGPTMYKNFFNSDFQSFSETRHSVKLKCLFPV